MNKFNFTEVMAKMNAVKATLPKILANDAQRFFGQSFAKEGFEDIGVKKWAARKKITKKNEGKNILVQSGRLRRAVLQSARVITWEKIVFTVDVPYAKIHNEGGAMAKGGTMPKREFMGNSATLNKLIIKKINLAVDKIWRG